MASNASKASDWHKVSGFSGVMTIGKEPTFDEVYGSGAAPMIVAHDKSVQKIPSPTRIAFESVLFGPGGDGKSTANRDHDVIKPEGVDLSKLSAACDLTTKKAIEEMSGKIIGSEPAKPDAGFSVSSTPTGVILHDEEHARLLAEAKVTRDIDTVTDFQSLVPVAHEMAVAKGWWQDGIDNRSIEEIVANYHAEISEAWEEYRAGRMATWYAEGSKKPEGFWVEIADLLIRIADAIGAGREHTTAHTRRVGFVSDIVSKIGSGTTVPGFITRLHDCISNGEGAVSVCESFASVKRVNLYAAVREKLRYNATRPYRHGGKLA